MAIIWPKAENNLFGTNYLWPTLWSSSFQSVGFRSRCDPIVTQDCCNLSLCSCIQVMLYYSGPSCCRWYLESILLWPYWFGCLNSTVRAATPCPVCMAHSFLTSPWFHQPWMRYTAAAFIFSSSRSLWDYNTTEEHNIPHTGDIYHYLKGATETLCVVLCVQQHVQACVFSLLCPTALTWGVLDVSRAKTTQDGFLPLCLFMCVCATVSPSLSFLYSAGMLMHKCFCLPPQTPIVPSTGIIRLFRATETPDPTTSRRTSRTLWYWRSHHHQDRVNSPLRQVCSMGEMAPWKRNPFMKTAAALWAITLATKLLQYPQGLLITTTLPSPIQGPRSLWPRVVPVVARGPRRAQRLLGVQEVRPHQGQDRAQTLVANHHLSDSLQQLHPVLEQEAPPCRRDPPVQWEISPCLTQRSLKDSGIQSQLGPPKNVLLSALTCPTEGLQDRRASSPNQSQTARRAPINL